MATTPPAFYQQVGGILNDFMKNQPMTEDSQQEWSNNPLPPLPPASPLNIFTANSTESSIHIADKKQSLAKIQIPSSKPLTQKLFLMSSLFILLSAGFSTLFLLLDPPKYQFTSILQYADIIFMSTLVILLVQPFVFPWTAGGLSKSILNRYVWYWRVLFVLCLTKEVVHQFARVSDVKRYHYNNNFPGLYKNWCVLGMIMSISNGLFMGYYARMHRYLPVLGYQERTKGIIMAYKFNHILLLTAMSAGLTSFILLIFYFVNNEKTGPTL